MGFGICARRALLPVDTVEDAIRLKGVRVGISGMRRDLQGYNVFFNGTHAMKPTTHTTAGGFVRNTMIALSVLGAAMLTAQSAAAAPLTWDSDGTYGTGITEGSGPWDTSTANWYGTVPPDQTWPNTTSDDAIFGGGTGAAGAVTVGTVTANTITFNAAGAGNYTLSGGTITLRGQLGWSNVPNVTVN